MVAKERVISLLYMMSTYINIRNIYVLKYSELSLKKLRPQKYSGEKFLCAIFLFYLKKIGTQGSGDI